MSWGSFLSHHSSSDFKTSQALPCSEGGEQQQNPSGYNLYTHRLGKESVAPEGIKANNMEEPRTAAFWAPRTESLLDTLAFQAVCDLLCGPIRSAVSEWRHPVSQPVLHCRPVLEASGAPGLPRRIVCLCSGGKVMRQKVTGVARKVLN